MASIPQPHSCYNGNPPKDTVQVQDGWINTGIGGTPGVSTRVPKMVTIPNVMSRECVYSRDYPHDPLCLGCNRKHSNN